MKMKQLPVGPIGTNCYIISSTENNAMIVDPGFDGEKILEYCQKENLSVKLILLTHGHFDHIWALNYVKQKTGAPIYIHTDDAEMLDDTQKNVAWKFGVKGFEPTTADVLLKDGDTVTLDELTFKTLHTPGHSKGSSCFVCGNMMLSGDTLFEGTVGRVDHYGGDLNVLISSVKSLAKLEGDYAVYSGHGNPTTLEKERQTNPYLGVAEYDDLF